MSPEPGTPPPKELEYNAIGPAKSFLSVVLPSSPGPAADKGVVLQNGNINTIR